MEHVVKEVSEQNYSYKLDIRIIPNKKNETEKTSKAYWLTKYYDSVSGLTMRFKGTRGQDDKQFVFCPVDDFDEVGAAATFPSETGSEFPLFPLHGVFNFLFSIGERFHGCEEGIVVKWPEYLEEAFKSLGISTENFDDYFDDHNKSMLIDFEKSDADFFQLIGKPRVASSTFGSDGRGGYSNPAYSNSRFQKFEIDGKGISYQVKLKIFWPHDDSDPSVEKYIPPTHN